MNTKMIAKIDVSQTSWDANCFREDVASTRELITNLLASIPAGADTSAVELGDVGNVLRFLNLLDDCELIDKHQE